MRGVRPIERELEHGRRGGRSVRGYCLAVQRDHRRRAAAASASGIKLHDRLEAIHASVEGWVKRGWRAPRS